MGAILAVVANKLYQEYQGYASTCINNNPELEVLRWRYMTATPIIDVTFDGNAFNVRSNTDGDLFFFDHIIGEESESNVNGRTQKVSKLEIK